MSEARSDEEWDRYAGVVPDLPIRWSLPNPVTRPERALWLGLAAFQAWRWWRDPGWSAPLWPLLCLVWGLAPFERRHRYRLDDDRACGAENWLHRPRLAWKNVARVAAEPGRIVLSRASGRFPVVLDLPEDERLRARIVAAVRREVPPRAWEAHGP